MNYKTAMKSQDKAKGNRVAAEERDKMIKMVGRQCHNLRFKRMIRSLTPHG